MMIARRDLLLSAGALAATPLAAQTAPAPRPLPDSFAPAELRGDLDVLARAYGLLHPGLTRYLAPGGFDALVGRARDWAAQPRTPAEVYLMLARLTAAVRCGHTHANPGNQRRTVQQQLLNRRDRLPLCTAWLGGRLYVTDGLATGLAPGTEIAAIDGVAANRLLAAMLPLARADGSNDAKRVALLELRPGERSAAFDVLRPLLFPPPEAGVVRLSARAPGASTARTLALPAIGEEERGVSPSADPQFGWRFAIGADGVGVMTMPNWGLYRTSWDWGAWIDRCVDELVAADARGLVVDLRANEGGLDCGDRLLARLIDRPIADDGKRRRVRFRETPADLRPVLDTWDPSFHTLGRDGTGPDAVGFYDLPAADTRRILPTGRRFTGQVAVLVGPNCSSATFNFAELVRRERLATLVGEPTGGNRRGINGGAYFFVRLPATLFEVDLPLIGYFPRQPEPDAGLIPDHVVPRTPAALATGRDPAMSLARRLVGGRA
jgi:hypothetical protein